MISLSLFACGYSFYERPKVFQPHWKTIFIPPFKNYTQDPEFSEMLAYELRHKFAQGKILLPVYREEEADLVLRGEVTRIYVEPISYEVFLQTRERRVLFEGKFQLLERKTQQKIHENPKLTRFETYRVLEIPQGSVELGKVEALRKLSQDIAELIFQEIIFK
ncbi:MAG: LPS assembly lipoprotein LptE [Caldimicrobium sp.]|nr:LPS assembly lipoprotein LptE [Caldimicrobium sp.]MDW8093513.1 LptE family protein [Caldimicrobium sp.]